MIPKSFDAIDKSDIDDLIRNGVSEHKMLEYKQKLPGTSDGDKKEFLADVASFGNAAGGDIIFGIRAEVDKDGNKTGGPDSVVPIEDLTVDKAKQRLEEVIRNGIAPRLRLQIKPVTGWGDNGQGFVILIRIPASNASPHMIIYKGWSRFYSRNSAGKYQLDVQELRAGFLARESQAQRVREFLLDRIAKIHSDDTPVPLKSKDRIVLHLIPTSFFLSGQRLQLADQNDLSSTFSPYYSDNHRYNLDGFLTSFGSLDRTLCYCQLMFNGCVELVNSDVMHTSSGNSLALVADILTFRGYTDRLYGFLNGLKAMDVAPPFLVHAAILGCAEGVVSTGRDAFFFSEYIHKLGKDEVLLPEAVLNEFPRDLDHLRTMLKPIGDGLFNACGLPKHIGYDDEGKWTR